MTTTVLTLGGIALYLVLAILAAGYGEKRNFGWWPTFIVSILLSPLLGFLIAALTAPKKQTPKATPQWKQHRERGNKAAYKGHQAEAIDAWKEAMYHLENDYPNLNAKEEERRGRELSELRSKIQDIKKGA